MREYVFFYSAEMAPDEQQFDDLKVMGSYAMAQVRK